MNKKVITALAVICIINAHHTIHSDNDQQEEIFLTSSALRYVDGVKNLLDGAALGLILQIRREVRKIHLGAPGKKNSLIGCYQFEGKPYSIRTLTILEQQNNAYKEKLITLFDKIKKDFEAIVDPFLESARGAKEYMIQLIEEFCKKRNRTDSFILEWAETDDGDESEIFNARITSFKDLDIFCTDLADFLAVLARSCQKAKAQLMGKYAHIRK